MSRGGFVAFRGSAQVAEDYLAGKLQPIRALNPTAYLANGRPFQHGSVTAEGVEVDALSRDEFRAWAEHLDPATGETRGAFRRKDTQRIAKDGSLETVAGGTPLYQETTVSASKSLSLAAAAHPEIAEALEAAMERATTEAARALHEHAVTRVGSRGKQQQVHFDRLEFTSVQHTTSRTGDPHMHRHVQFLSSGLVTLPSGEQSWRALDGASLYRLSERVHAAADLSLSTDTELRQAIAAAGFTWVPAEGGGKVVEFERLADDFSQRRDQVAAARETLEAQWRAEHPRQQPSAKLMRTWDNHGWSQTRPKKHELDAEAKADQQATLATIKPANLAHWVESQSVGSVSPRTIAADVLAQLASQQSAWSKADLKAAIDRRLAQTYLIGNNGLAQLQADCLRAAEPQLVSFYDQGVEVEGARHWTSKAVLATDRAVSDSLFLRAQQRGIDGTIVAERKGFTLTASQAAAARSITGTHKLVVIEGAAGTGKSALLGAAADELALQGRRMVNVSPTKRGAQEMAKAVGGQGDSVHALLVRAGASFDENGVWTLPKQWRQQPPEFWMGRHTVLVVDEVGMLDMDTAAALHRYADDTDVSLVLMGDRKQLSAVGRGGYLAKAVHATTVAHDLRDVRRFQTAEKKIDQTYAVATLELRDRKDAGDFFDLLAERGQVRTGQPDEVVDGVADSVASEIRGGQSSIAIASTNATAQRINHAVYQRLANAGAIDTRITAIGRDGDPIAVGAKVATRQNDRERQVANRQVWIVQHINADGRVIVADEESGRHTTLDAAYVQDHLQLGYAVTAHGSQGMTVDRAHVVLSDRMDAAGAYVGLTRGRLSNTLHAVASDSAEAREQFEAAIARQSIDEGLDDARAQARQDLQQLSGERTAEVPASERTPLQQEPAQAPALPPAEIGVRAHTDLGKDDEFERLIARQFNELVATNTGATPTPTSTPIRRRPAMADRKTQLDQDKARIIREELAAGGEHGVARRFGEAELNSAEFREAQRQQRLDAQRRTQLHRDAAAEAEKQQAERQARQQAERVAAERRALLQRLRQEQAGRDQDKLQQTARQGQDQEAQRQVQQQATDRAHQSAVQHAREDREQSGGRAPAQRRARTATQAPTQAERVKAALQRLERTEQSRSQDQEQDQGVSR